METSMETSIISYTYKLWVNLKKKGFLCREWESFIQFLECIKEIPGGQFIRPKNPQQLIGPNNFTFDDHKTFVRSGTRKLIEYKGEIKTVRQMQEILGVSRQRVHQRIDAGEFRVIQ